MKSNTVLIMIQQQVIKEGSQRALARKIGVSPTFLNEIIRETRNPTGKVLAYLGLERIVTYQRISERSRP